MPPQGALLIDYLESRDDTEPTVSCQDCAKDKSELARSGTIKSSCYLLVSVPAIIQHPGLFMVEIPASTGRGSALERANK